VGSLHKDSGSQEAIRPDEKPRLTPVLLEK
jgi:hypothetical protein